MSVRVGVLAAMAVEARAWGRSEVESGRVVAETEDRLFCLCGIGPERARQGAELLWESGARALLLWGIAGGLDPAVRCGDVLLPAEVVDSGGARLPTDATWRRALREQLGDGLCVREEALYGSDTVLPDPVSKSEAFRRTRAAGVDMESRTVAELARAHGVPLVVLKVVCDPAGDTLPPAAMRVDWAGRPRTLGLLRSLASDPGQLRELLRLRRAFRTARRSLQEAAARIRERPFVYAG